MKKVVLNSNQEAVIRRLLERLGEPQQVDLVEELGIANAEGFINSLKKRTRVKV